MGFLSFIKDLPLPDDPHMPIYASFVMLSLLVLRSLSIAGRPVVHPDKKSLVGKHKEAEAERVDALERLSSGSKSVDVQVKELGSADLVDLGAELSSDVEKDPLWLPLLAKSDKEENLVTVSLSTSIHGLPLAFGAYDVMKAVSEEAAASGGESAADSFICSSEKSMLQSKVVLREGMLERLKELVNNPCLVKQPTPPNVANEQLRPSPLQAFTPVLQVDSWAILKPSDQGVDFRRLPVDKVPVIIHAEYAAGTLTITGLNLQDANIYLSAEDATSSVKLDVWRFLKGTDRNLNKNFRDSREDILSVPVRLSWKSMKHSFIYATKKVDLGDNGESVHAVSKAVRVIDSFWATVLRLWVPTMLLLIFTVYAIRKILTVFQIPFSFVTANSFPGCYLTIFLCIMMFAKSNRIVEFFKYHIETLLGGLGQGLLVFYHGFKSLDGPQLVFHKYLPRRIPPQPMKSSSSEGVTSVRSSVEAATGRSSTSVHIPARSLPPSSEDSSVRSVDDPDWQWPTFEEYEDKPGKTTLRRRMKEKTDEVSPFRVIYRRKKGLLWPDVVRIDLFSSPLIQTVQKLFPNNGDLQSLENPKIEGRDLFLQLDRLRNPENPQRTDTVDNPSHERSQDGSSEAAEKDESGTRELLSKHLVRFFEKEYADVLVRQKRMAQEKRVAWDMLWTFLAPGKKVVYKCDHSQELLAAVVARNTYSHTRSVHGSEQAFSVELEIWDYDGTRYRKCQISRTITSFVGEREFCDLAVRPIEMEGVPEILKERFLANGKRFQDLSMKSKHRFMHYSGSMYRLKSSFELVKENADGRVMIDLGSFAKMNPGDYMGTAKPPVASGCSPFMFDSVRGRRIKEHPVVAQFRPDLTAPADTDVISDETLMFAPAIVYGFSFTLRRWGSFAVSGFSEISFDTNAFDALVMEADRKQLVYDLVSQYIGSPVDTSAQQLPGFDPISQKGEGCIFLCYGPPGTGKTLTAESLAENMHRPLWSLNVSELGVAPNDLEKTLFKVLDIATTWQAVLLLDEADVFLEKRSSNNLSRSALTGVFLRFLEYYRGVLFLTTNRIETFDNAFRSRISMFLHYPQLTRRHKEQVWKTLLDRAGVADVTAEFIAQMAADNLNGREIRNVIHTAQIWAKSQGQPLGRDHVTYSEGVLVRSLRTLSDSMKTSAKAFDHDQEEGLLD